VSDEPIRVLRIIDRLNIGGPAKHVTWLTAGLDPRRYETVLVTGRVPACEGDMTYFTRAAGIEPIVLDEMSRDLSVVDAVVVVRLLRLMRRFRPDIVHTHKSKAGAVGRMAALLYRWFTPAMLFGRPRRCRVVHTFHGHTFHGYFGAFKERIFLLLERLLARLATDRIVVISEQQRSEISARFGVGRADQFRVIPLGIDVDDVATRPLGLRDELGFGRDDLLVGIVGRLCPIKNHSLFLRAVRQIVERGGARGARFVVIGDGELRADLEAEAKALGIADRVTFTGFRREATHLYSDLDLVVLTSRNEGTPVTLIEALCAARAVVSTEVGGVVDILGKRGETIDGVTRWQHGLTAASGDAAALGRAIEELLSAPRERIAMGALGRSFVRERLSRERLLADVADLYQELARGGEVEVMTERARRASPDVPRVSPRSASISSRP
jgi:glycosyltransferase involved in cell wall biosynthesis